MQFIKRFYLIKSFFHGLIISLSALGISRYLFPGNAPAFVTLAAIGILPVYVDLSHKLKRIETKEKAFCDAMKVRYQSYQHVKFDHTLLVTSYYDLEAHALHSHVDCLSCIDYFKVFLKSNETYSSLNILFSYRAAEIADAIVEGLKTNRNVMQVQLPAEGPSPEAVKKINTAVERNKQSVAKKVTEVLTREVVDYRGDYQYDNPKAMLSMFPLILEYANLSTPPARKQNKRNVMG